MLSKMLVPNYGPCSKVLQGLLPPSGAWATEPCPAMCAMSSGAVIFCVGSPWL